MKNITKNHLKIIVPGYIIRGPIGGMTWHHLQYVIGLANLGHDVYFLEDSADYESCYDPSKNKMGVDPTYGLKFTKKVFERVGSGNNWAYYDEHTRRWFGPCKNKITEICSQADLLLNMSGKNPIRPWFENIPIRAIVDTDPAFTQICHLTDYKTLEQAKKHTTFHTFGENFGNNTCSIPNDGFNWQPTRQPIVLEAWKTTSGSKEGKFTTVMQWDSYAAREFNGKHYGMKSGEFKKFIELPKKVGNIFELAVGSSSVPRDLLVDKGWKVIDPLIPTKDPWTYQEFIRFSKAEFTVAKHGYVVTNSGWFSERSAAYLASGRPVITQQTGFSEWLPTGEGVLAFNNMDQAIAAIEDVNSRYEFHCKRAREIAEEYFDYKKVLPKLIDTAMNSVGK